MIKNLTKIKGGNEMIKNLTKIKGGKEMGKKCLALLLAMLITIASVTIVSADFTSVTNYANTTYDTLTAPSNIIATTANGNWTSATADGITFDTQNITGASVTVVADPSASDKSVKMTIPITSTGTSIYIKGAKTNVGTNIDTNILLQTRMKINVDFDSATGNNFTFGPYKVNSTTYWDGKTLVKFYNTGTANKISWGGTDIGTWTKNNWYDIKFLYQLDTNMCTVYVKGDGETAITASYSFASTNLAGAGKLLTGHFPTDVRSTYNVTAGQSAGDVTQSYFKADKVTLPNLTPTLGAGYQLNGTVLSVPFGATVGDVLSNVTYTAGTVEIINGSGTVITDTTTAIIDSFKLRVKDTYGMVKSDYTISLIDGTLIKYLGATYDALTTGNIISTGDAAWKNITNDSVSFQNSFTGGSVAVVEDPSANDKSVKMTIPSNTTGTNIYLRAIGGSGYTIGANTDTSILLQTRVRINVDFDSSAGNNFTFGPTQYGSSSYWDGSNAVKFYNDGTGNKISWGSVWVTSAFVPTVVGTWTKNNWYDIKLLYQLDKNLCTLYIKGDSETAITSSYNFKWSQGNDTNSDLKTMFPTDVRSVYNVTAGKSAGDVTQSYFRAASIGYTANVTTTGSPSTAGNITANYKFINPFLMSNCNVFIALYDIDKKLIKVSPTTLSATNLANVTVTGSPTLAVAAGDAAAGNYAKVFVWNGVSLAPFIAATQIN